MMQAQNSNSRIQNLLRSESERRDHNTYSFVSILFSFHSTFFLLFFLLVIAAFRINSYIQTKSNIVGEPFVIYSHPYIIDFQQEIETQGGYRFYVPVQADKDNLMAGDCIKINKYQKLIGKILYNVDYDIVTPCHNYLLKNISLFRQKLINDYYKFMKSPRAGVVLGVTLGHKDEFSKRFRDQIKISGLSHILVVSGYNFLLIANLIRSIFSVINRQIYIVALVFFSLFYLMLCGLNPPAIRAIILSLILGLANIRGRNSNSMNALVYSVFIILIVFPNLYNSLSLLLSVLASFALNTSSCITTSNKVLGIFKESIIINIFLAPILIYFFGEYSMLSLISNLIVLDLIPYITMFGFLNLLTNDPILKIFLASWVDAVLYVIHLMSMIESNLKDIVIRLNLSVVEVYIIFIIYFLVYILYLYLKWKYRIQKLR